MDLLIIFFRGLSMAAGFSAFGALVFPLLVAPRAPPAIPLIRGSLTVAMAATLAWLLCAAPSPALFFRMAEGTHFGRLLLFQLGAFAAASLVFGRGRSPGRRRAATGLSGLASLLHAGHSHGYAMGDRLLLLSDGLHLLAAGAWLGGLAPLLLLVRAQSPEDGAAACRSFSPLGMVCVGTLAATAAYQGTVLAGDLAGLFGTPYGWAMLAKLALFLVLIGFAAANRTRFVPTLAKDRLIRSIALETACGLIVIFTAATLGSLPPAIHLQPVWPFPYRPSLVALAAESPVRPAVITALLALAAVISLLVLGALRHRIRWPAVVAAVIIPFALPYLGLFFIPATSSSYYRSPTGFAATAIAAGARLYTPHCAACHGPEGRGDGPAAQGLPVPPADLTAGHLWAHEDGELFGWLSDGIATPQGQPAMPGFAAQLAEDQRWDLIDFIRAREAGLALRTDGAWPVALAAPAFQVQCGDRRLAWEALRGKMIRLWFTGDSGVAPLPLPEDSGVDLVTILVGNGQGACHAGDPAVRLAYALLLGLPPGQMAGAQFLIDRDGWLRAYQRPGTLGLGWADPQRLLAEIREIAAKPVAAAPRMTHRHP